MICTTVRTRGGRKSRPPVVAYLVVDVPNMREVKKSCAPFGFGVRGDGRTKKRDPIVC